MGLTLMGSAKSTINLITLREQGKTILITSHSRDELKILCDQIFTLSSGRLNPYFDSGSGV